MCDDNSVNGDVIKMIIHHLDRFEKDAELTSASNFYQAQKWERYNWVIGMGAVVISGVVAVIGSTLSFDLFKQYNGLLVALSAILASFVSVLGSVLTFLKPSERAERYREFGNQHKAFRNKVRIYRDVTIVRMDACEAEKELKSFLDEKNKLNSDNPPIPREAFIEASKDMREKSKRKEGK